VIAHLVSWIIWMFGWHARVCAAYARGYDAMKRKLNAPYCGPDMGYDPLLVVEAYNEIRHAFKGSKRERASYEEGIRDAITAYEREFGAP
jgi:hypothetical protein